MVEKMNLEETEMSVCKRLVKRSQMEKRLWRRGEADIKSESTAECRCRQL